MKTKIIMKLPVYKVLTWLVFVGLFFNSGQVFSKYDESETAQVEEKLKAKMSVSFKQGNDNKRTVRVVIKHKDKEKKEMIYGKNMDVLLYINEIAPANLIGKNKTNFKGVAIIEMNDLFYAIADTTTSYDFIVQLPENDTYKEKQKSVTIEDVKLEMEVYEEDSIRYVKARLQKNMDTSYVPLADVKISFGLKCTFSNLPFGGDYTSTGEDGYVKVVFPNDHVGDEEGNVGIVVSLIDHETYGNVEKIEKVNWAVPLVIDNSDLKQKLWSSQANAPLALVTTIVILILGIWGTLFYLMFDLLKIRKMGKK
jgi:hypothetical protein